MAPQNLKFFIVKCLHTSSIEHNSDRLSSYSAFIQFISTYAFQKVFQ